MNNIKEEDIKQLVLKIAEEQNEHFYLSDLSIKYIKDTDKELLFEVTAMYDKPFKASFKALKEFSSLFNTDNIDVYEDISYSGCETCDHGSSYGYAIRVWK